MISRRAWGYPTTLAGRTFVRALTLADFLIMLALLPFSCLWILWDELGSEIPRALRSHWKSLRTGKVGPYKGCVW